MPSTSPSRPTNRPNSVMFLTSPSTIDADRKLLDEDFPRIVHGLLEAERDAALVRIDLEHLHFDFLRGGDDLAGMDVLLGPAHFGDVDQAFDARLQFHEGAVVGDVGDAAREAARRPDTWPRRPPTDRSSSCFMPSEMRWVSGLILMIWTFTVWPIVEHLGRVLDALPRDVGDVQQAVDAAEVHERAVVGDVLDDAVDDLAFFQVLRRAPGAARRGSLRARRGARRRCCRGGGPS